MAINKVDIWLKSTLIIDHETCEILFSNVVNSTVERHIEKEKKRSG